MRFLLVDGRLVIVTQSRSPCSCAKPLLGTGWCTFRALTDTATFEDKKSGVANSGLQLVDLETQTMKCVHEELWLKSNNQGEKTHKSLCYAYNANIYYVWPDCTISNDCPFRCCPTRSALIPRLCLTDRSQTGLFSGTRAFRCRLF